MGELPAYVPRDLLCRDRFECERRRSVVANDLVKAAHTAIVDYVRGIRRKSPRDLVTVFVPEYVVGHWWEHLLHNQSALRIKGRLLFEPGVMVTSVPWQLRSSQDRDLDRLDRDLSRAPARGPRTFGGDPFRPPAPTSPAPTGDRTGARD